MGYRLLERNVRLGRGEIDIVARDGSILVFVEVRTRRGSAQGLPEESITWRKKRTLRHLVDQYLQSRRLTDVQCRIDVVVIEIGRQGAPTRIEVIKNAVEG